MKKIELILMTMQLNISDEMIKDFQECREMAKRLDWEGKDCENCSWNVVEIEGAGLCELVSEEQILGESVDGKTDA